MQSSSAPTTSSQHRVPYRAARHFIVLSALVTVFASLARTFEVALPGEPFAATRFFYLVGALLLPGVFMLFPSFPRAVGMSGKTRRILHALDWLLAGLTFVVLGACYVFAARIDGEGWEFAPPGTAGVMAIVAWLLLMEIGRRCGGWSVLIVTGCFSIYPLAAEQMPALLDGLSYSFVGTVSFHLYGAEGFQGIPMRAFADWAIGYLLFGAVLQWTGGGTFFLDLTFALLGRVRGGPAKVSILASGLMGSVSGSVVSNVLTTGALTVPAMRRSGFTPHYAAGVEACASTGGVLMPPIMGAAAFVMARYLNVPYTDVALAALIPSLLYFYGLFVQIDAYAARHGLLGIRERRFAGLARTVFQGWHFLAVFGVLVGCLLGANLHREAPYIASAALLLLALLRGQPRAYIAKLGALLLETGIQLIELAGILAPVGVIIGALMMTGMVGNLTYDMVSVAGSNLGLLLIFGALTAFVLGIGMTVVAAYTFLAVTLAPILIAVGVDPMAAHMFILYWGMLSYITPPVAIGAFAAAGLAGANPMRTGFEAMRLGTVIYFIPFFFVLNPNLLLSGPLDETIRDLALSLAGITALAAGLQGFVLGIGKFSTKTLGAAGRSSLIAGGLLLALPGASPSVLAAATVLVAAGCLMASRGNGTPKPRP